MKICFKCKETKNPEAFGRNKCRKDGLQDYCLNCQKSIQSEYRKRNRDKAKFYQAEYRKINPDKEQAYKAKYRGQPANLDKIKMYQAEYRRSNLEKFRAMNAKRRASKLLRMPKWLSELQFEHIKIFYEAAVSMTKETNIPFEVDHIVPLRGANVSGLHVPWNLQVITEYENCSKSNNYCFSSSAMC